MTKKLLVTISIVVALFLVGGGIFAYTTNQNDKKEQEKTTMAKKTEDEAMMKKQEAAAIEKDKMTKDADPMTNKDTESKQGTYVTLADYNKDPSKYTDSTKVYFFHASWCSICQGIEKEIIADVSKVPAGVTLIKTDFDSSTDLRKKYGVTVQYTFVQVDDSGNKTAQWSATTLAKAIAPIKF